MNGQAFQGRPANLKPYLMRKFFTKLMSLNPKGGGKVLLLVLMFLSVAIAADAQQRVVTGKVVDAAGQPVIGATVVETGTMNGVATGVDGQFSISLRGEGKELTVESLGYITQTLNIAGKDIRIAVAHGLGNARKLLESIRSGEKSYEFVEIMACPGGCVTGGGQPIVSAKGYMDKDVKAERAKALYSEDKNATLRKSHENPDIKLLYSEFLEKPGSHKSHELLHTKYTARSRF